MDTDMYEQLISRRNLRWQTVLRIVLVEGLTLVGLLGLFSGEMVVLGAAILLGVLAWYFLFPLFRVEYEYILVGRDLTIDVIYGQRRRKTVAVMDLSKVEVAPGTPEKGRMGQFYDATSGNGGGNTLEIRLPRGHRIQKIWIEPDERLAGMMAHWIRAHFI